MKRIFENDFHVHTSYSPCAFDSPHPLEVLAHAEKLGIKAIGFTDHFAQFPERAIPANKNCGPTMIYHLREDLKANQTNVQVLVGCEADLVTCENLSIDAAFAAQLDFVMVAASHFHISEVQQPDGHEPRKVAEHFLQFLHAAMDFDFVTVIAHPFIVPYHVLGKPDTYISQIEKTEFLEVAETALKKNIAFDINGDVLTDQSALRALIPFFRLCKDVGVKFTYGSDAHHLRKMGITKAKLDGIQEIGLEPNDFLSPDQLVNW